MSLLGGLFSHRAALAPPPVNIESYAQNALEPDADPGSDRSFEFALDALPCNAMFCDRDLILRYLNRSSRKTLLTLQQHLPVPVDQVVGKSIHIFHKSKERIDSILGGNHHNGMHHLPHKATIALGPVKLDLQVSPMTGERGEYIGAVVLWGVSTQQAIDALRKAQESQRSDIEHLNGNLQMVATATHEIEASIAEIARNAVDVSVRRRSRATASAESKTAIESLRIRAAAWPKWRS